MHYDPPPPSELTDLEAMRQRGEFRFANKLSAYIELEDTKITSSGYSGGLLMGRTPISAGPSGPCCRRKGTGNCARCPALPTPGPPSSKRSADGRSSRSSGRLPAGHSSP